MSTPQNYLLLSATLFTIGIAVMAMRKHRLVKLLGFELMLHAVNLALSALTSRFQDWEGQVTTLAIITIAASELIIGLGVAAVCGQRHISRGSILIGRPNSQESASFQERTLESQR